MSNYTKYARLILTVDEAKKDHDKWLKVRNEGIGGSDAGTILNLNPWKDRYTLWAEKTGRAEPKDLSNNEKVYWGTKQEPLVAERFEEETGYKVRKMGTVQSLINPFMFANVDRMVVGKEAGLEIKTTDFTEAIKWDNGEIPNNYYCQCLHYLAVLPNIKRWYIAVLIGGNRYKCTYIDRSDDEVNYLIQKEKEFWEYVKNDVEPPVTDTDTCTDVLKSIYKGQKDLIHTLTEEELKYYKEYKAVKEKINELNAKATLNKNLLIRALGNAEYAFMEGHKEPLISYKQTKGKTTTSLAKIRDIAPDIYEELEKRDLITTSKGSRIFRVY